ncbi:MAG: hypothetical protein ABIQ95_11145 [Bdellovibrionia bacterium]
MRINSVSFRNSISVCLLLWVTAFTVTSIGLPQAGFADQVDPLEKQLKSALLEAQKSLGVLEPWQKTLYMNDVLPQYQKFIKDYSRSGLAMNSPTDSASRGTHGVKAVIDEESLKRFLLFYGPKVLKKKDTRVLILLRPHPTCQRCLESLNVISDLVQAQMWRRGMTPNLMSTDELKLPATEVEIQDQVVAMAKEKGADASVVVQWGPAPVDDIDTAHADELRFVLRSFLKVGDFSPILKEREVVGNDSFLVSEASLLVDLFTNLGATLEKEQTKVNDAGKAEVLIEVTGIKGFAQFTRVKSQIQTILKESSTIEERKLSLGQASFAIYSSRSSEELKSLFLNADLDPGHGERLKVEVLP